MKENTNNLTGSERVSTKINSFLATHFKLVIGVCVAIVVAVAAVAIVLTSIADKKAASFDMLLEAETAYNTLSLMDQADADYQATLDDFTSRADALVAEGLDAYPGAKAQYLLADKAYADGDYQKAADLYLAVAEAQSSTYLGQLCTMNAAACYDSLSDNAKAFELYNSIFETYGEESPFAPKALYNVARIYEAQGNMDLAAATLEQLTGLFLESATGNGSEYAKLAQARLISIQ